MRAWPLWLVLSSAAHAAPIALPEPVERPDPPPRYTGAFRALEVTAGSALSDDAGPSLELGARWSTPLHLADASVSYGLDALNGATVHRVELTGRLHPLLFFLIASDTLGPVLGGLYLSGGLGPALAFDPGDAGLAWHWGAGGDLPLTSPDAETGWWIGLQWQRGAYSGLDLEETVQHRVHLRLGRRFIGL